MPIKFIKKQRIQIIKRTINQILLEISDVEYNIDLSKLKRRIRHRRFPYGKGERRSKIKVEEGILNLNEKYNICVQNGLLRKYINENEKIQIIKIKENGNIIKLKKNQCYLLLK